MAPSRPWPPISHDPGNAAPDRAARLAVQTGPDRGAAMFDLQIILDDVVAVADRPARPSSFARSNRCLIDERCHRVPPHGVRSRMASSWEAICWSVRSGAAAAMPATSRSNRSFPVLWPGAIEQVRLDDAFRDQSSDGAAEPLGGQVAAPPWFRTRATSPRG